jgi:hypothetical protein
LIAVSVATGIAIASLGFYYLFYNSKSEKQLLYEELLEEIKKIGLVMINRSDGTIPFEKFVLIFKTVKKFAKMEIDPMQESLKEQRREILK